MSISNQTDKIFGIGDGITTVFSFPFKIFAATDLVVYEIDTTQTPNVSHTKTLTADYSVSINIVGEGGTVTFVTAPPLSWQTLIQRVEPFTQSLVLNTEGNLPAQQIENQLDLMTMLCIQVNEAVSRCPQLPVTYSGSLPLLMPSPQAGLVLGWDPTGTFLVNLVGTASGIIAVPISNANLQPISGSILTKLNNTQASAGILPIANIASGTPTGSKFVRDDGTLQSIPYNGPVLGVRSSASQSFSGNTWTKRTFDTIDKDSGGYWSSNRYTPLSAGWYLISYTDNIKDTGGAAISGISIYKNGSAYVSTTGYIPGANNSDGPSIIALIQMNGSTDYIEFFVYSGGSASSAGVSSPANGDVSAVTALRVF